MGSTVIACMLSKSILTWGDKRKVSIHNTFELYSKNNISMLKIRACGASKYRPGIVNGAGVKNTACLPMISP